MLSCHDTTSDRAAERSQKSRTHPPPRRGVSPHRGFPIQPEFSGALWGKALLAIGGGKYDDAAGLLERAIASSPRDLDVWMFKGDLQAIGSRMGRLAAYRKVLEIDPENMPARLTIASMRVGAGDPDGAQQVVDPDARIRHSDGEYTEGLVLARRGNFAAAQAAAGKVLIAAPESGAEPSAGRPCRLQARLVR